MSNQVCTVFIAEGLEAGQHSREHEEQDMRQRWFSQAGLVEMIKDGMVTDAATNASYLLYLISDQNHASCGFVRE
jgi:hypothetical protein